MPTPILHSAFAAASAKLGNRNGLTPKTLLPFLTASLLPDLDLLPGYLLGDPMRFHHTLSHSIVFAVAVACLLSLIPWSDDDEAAAYPRRLGFLLTVSLSHPLLDLFTYDPFGICRDIQCGLMLGWPFSARRWDILYPIFSGVQVSTDWRVCLSAVNLRVMAMETLEGAALIGLSAYLARLPEYLRLRRVPSAAKAPALETVRIDDGF